MNYCSKYVFGIAIILLSSCRLESIALEVLKPAEITLPPDINSIVIANRATLDDATFAAVNKGNIISRYKKFNDIAIEEAVWTAGEMLSGFERLFILIADTLDIPNKKEDVPLRLTPSQVRFYRDLYNADALLSLDGFRVDVQSNGTVNTVLETDEMGFTFEVPFFRERRTVVVEALWRFYDLKNDTILLQKKITARRSFLGEGFTPSESLESMPSKGSSILMVAAETGERIAAPFLPFWEPLIRRLYVNYNEEFIDAFSLAYVGEWAKAYEIWEKKENQGRKSLRKQAGYNITVALEALEFFDEALNLNNQYYKLYKDKIFKKRRKELEARIQEQKVLDEQFGLKGR